MNASSERPAAAHAEDCPRPRASSETTYENFINDDALPTRKNMRQMAPTRRLRRGPIEPRQRRRVKRVRFCTARIEISRSTKMLDVILLAGGFGFFALSIAYAYACDWL